jgi:hypothetical protein
MKQMVDWSEFRFTRKGWSVLLFSSLMGTFDFANFVSGSDVCDLSLQSLAKDAVS